MKRISTLLIIAFVTFSTIAQNAPVIESYSMPARGTRYLQVFDADGKNIPIPLPGTGTTWNYATVFSVTDTMSIRTVDPDSIAQLVSGVNVDFANATFATLNLNPADQSSDSLLTFFQVDTGGLYVVGGFDLKNTYDTTFQAHIRELILPGNMDSAYNEKDTSRIIGYGTISGFNIKYTKTKYKHIRTIGYGKLISPIGTFSDVLLAKESTSTVDSVFVDLLGTGVYTYTSAYSNNMTYNRYHFLRNNTFATAHLMMIQTDSADSTVTFAWYTLPVDIGKIHGIVKDNLNAAIKGKALAHLYRDFSNFTRNDILATAQVDTNGYYAFDSIPYGQYRVAVMADTSQYPNVLTTYYGDTVKWKNASTVKHDKDSMPLSDMHLRYHLPLTGSGKIKGSVRLIWDAKANYKTSTGDPIPGIDIVVENTIDGDVAIDVDTDVEGDFSVSGLNDGDYNLFVDIPGLEMVNTYNITISGGTIVENLDFVVSSDSIYTSDIVVNLPQVPFESDIVKVYPNPVTNSAYINFNLRKTQNVNIELFDLNGQLITNLTAGEKNTGKYLYAFNLKQYASGSYLIRFTSKETGVLNIPIVKY